MRKTGSKLLQDWKPFYPALLSDSLRTAKESSSLTNFHGSRHPVRIFRQPFTLKETEQFFREKQFRVVMAADRRMLYGLRRDRVFSGTAEPE
ncbi:MAG: hypothetical protein IKD69_02850 [Solobacterium sp.]|nr:hypothetical protein [Solobacterium sp.]